MLLLSTARSITVDDVTVFPDHADPNQFWYLPGPVKLAKRPDGESAFTFIKYKPAAVEAGVKGGGFVMFTSSLAVSDETKNKILSKLRQFAPGDPILNLAQFDSGTVKCVALNLQGSGETKAAAAKAGTFNAVEEILGANTPSLQGDEDAAFSLSLSQEGAIILEQAFKQGTGPIGVIYDLKFTGLRPSLDVKITADFQRIFDGLSVGLSGQYYFVKADLQAQLEKLVQDGAIKIEVTNFTSDADAKDKEKWALDFFTEHLLTKWFEPTLGLGKPIVDTSSGGGPLDSVAGAVSKIAGGDKGKSADAGQGSGANKGTTSDKSTTANKGTTTDTSKSATPTKASAASAGATTDASKSASAGASAGKDSASASLAAPSATAAKTSAGSSAAAATAPAVAHAPAVLKQTPEPPPAGFGMQHKSATSGTKETVAVLVDNGVPKSPWMARLRHWMHPIS